MTHAIVSVEIIGGGAEFELNVHSTGEFDQLVDRIGEILEQRHPNMISASINQTPETPETPARYEAEVFLSTEGVPAYVYQIVPM